MNAADILALNKKFLINFTNRFLEMLRTHKNSKANKKEQKAS